MFPVPYVQPAPTVPNQTPPLTAAIKIIILCFMDFDKSKNFEAVQSLKWVQ